jgi:hypothetical protein
MTNNIKLIDLLSEGFKKGNKIGSGTEHDIFQSLTDEDRVLKCNRGNKIDNTDWVKLFKRYPKYFPKVYGSDDKCVEIEKLDTDKAVKDYEILEKALEDDAYRFVNEDEGWTLSMILVNLADNPKMLKQVLKVIIDKKPDSVETFKKFFNLTRGIIKIMQGKKPDINKLNFAYTKDGSLKMIDI